MKYENFQTFSVYVDGAIATVTFNFGTTNIQGQEMLADLNSLDMRFTARGKFKFMQIEVGMGILPCGGGASRMARQTGLGRALEIILSAQDYGADEA